MKLVNKMTSVADNLQIATVKYENLIDKTAGSELQREVKIRGQRISSQIWHLIEMIERYMDVIEEKGEEEILDGRIVYLDILRSRLIDLEAHLMSKE